MAWFFVIVYALVPKKDYDIAMAATERVVDVFDSAEIIYAWNQKKQLKEQRRKRSLSQPSKYILPGVSLG